MAFFNLQKTASLELKSIVWAKLKKRFTFKRQQNKLPNESHKSNYTGL
jgi:hypothetical protein